MQWRCPLWALVGLLSLAGCNGILFWKKPERLDVEKVCEAKGAPAGSTTPLGARMEFQDIRYDGKNLAGRLLISSKGGALCLDKRFIEEFVLVTEAVSECGTGRDPGFFVTDVLAPPLTEEDVLVLKPGYWYGKDVSIFLFSERITGKTAPECIEAEFTFHALNAKHAARLRVRAMRTEPPKPDAATPMVTPPTPDAEEQLKLPGADPTSVDTTGP